MTILRVFFQPGTMETGMAFDAIEVDGDMASVVADLNAGLMVSGNVLRTMRSHDGSARIIIGSTPVAFQAAAVHKILPVTFPYLREGESA